MGFEKTVYELMIQLRTLNVEKTAHRTIYVLKSDGHGGLGGWSFMRTARELNT